MAASGLERPTGAAPTTLRSEIAEGVRWLLRHRLLGRVNSAYALFGFGSLSLGAIFGGVLAARAGLTAPFWCSFAAMAALTLACWPLLSSRAMAHARAQAATGD